jgi:hypothetical protein
MILLQQNEKGENRGIQRKQGNEVKVEEDVSNE